MAKRIYVCLEDELSKQVVLKWINYLIIGDYRFVEEYVSLCHLGYSVWNRSDKSEDMITLPEFVLGLGLG